MGIFMPSFSHLRKMPADLTRAQQTELQTLTRRVDRVTQADRAFFKRRPLRQHRLRLASQAELQYEELLIGNTITVPPGCRMFTIVRQIASGVRLRMHVFLENG